MEDSESAPDPAVAKREETYRKKCAAMAKARAAFKAKREAKKAGLIDKLGTDDEYSRRVARFTHGLSKGPGRKVSDLDYLRFQLERIDKSIPAVLEAFSEAQGGDSTKLDKQVSQRLAAKMILRDIMVGKIKKQGVSVKQAVIGPDGKKIGSRIVVHPLLEHLNKIDDQLGITAEAARLSKRARGQGERDDAITDALKRDARVREAKNLQLPPADPEILREAIETEVVEDDDKAENG